MQGTTFGTLEVDFTDPAHLGILWTTLRVDHRIPRSTATMTVSSNWHLTLQYIGRQPPQEMKHIIVLVESSMECC